MLDRDIVAVAPSTTYRVLKSEGLLTKWTRQKSNKGTGFEQPLKPHEHWHVDISYVNINSTFYYLCTILDGYSRYVVDWELKEQMKGADVELLLQRAREKHPSASPRIISDNGPQFIAKDFKLFIRETGMSHVRTSPYYPQSNGKIERYHKTLKSEAIRPSTPLSLEDARRSITNFIDKYNNHRLHSAVGYITPKDMLDGKQEQIHALRDKKIEEARMKRRTEAHHQNLNQAAA